MLIKVLDDMDYTMLRQMARRCRLLAHLHNSEFVDPILKQFADILDMKNTTKPKAPEELDDFAVACHLSKSPRMSPKQYKSIMDYLNACGEATVSWLSYPSIEYQSMILPPNARRLREYHEHGRTYSCNSVHHSHSLVQFRKPNSTDAPMTGVIQFILELPLHGFLRKFIFVAPHKPIDLSHTPLGNRPRTMTALVEIQPYKTLIVMEPKHIITHISAWKRPAHTYSGINKPFMTVGLALNRGRK